MDCGARGFADEGMPCSGGARDSVPPPRTRSRRRAGEEAIGEPRQTAPPTSMHNRSRPQNIERQRGVCASGAPSEWFRCPHIPEYVDGGAMKPQERVQQIAKTGILSRSPLWRARMCRSRRSPGCRYQPDPVLQAGERASHFLAYLLADRGGESCRLGWHVSAIDCTDDPFRVGRQRGGSFFWA
jgi:hypothetical protein